MKKIITTMTAVAMCAALAFAEDSSIKADEKPIKKDNPPVTLLGQSDVSFSGYGAPTVSFGPVGSTWGTWVGGRGGCIVNDAFVLGGGGKGLVYPDTREKISGSAYTGTEPVANIGYGGILFEYHYRAKDLLHFSIGTIVGGGGVIYTDSSYDHGNIDKGGDRFFVAEPEIGAYLNVTRFFRIGLTANYRFVYGAKYAEIGDSDLRGFSGSLVMAFGWF